MSAFTSSAIKDSSVAAGSTESWLLLSHHTTATEGNRGTANKTDGEGDFLYGNATKTVVPSVTMCRFAAGYGELGRFEATLTETGGKTPLVSEGQSGGLMAFPQSVFVCRHQAKSELWEKAWVNWENPHGQSKVIKTSHRKFLSADYSNFRTPPPLCEHSLFDHLCPFFQCSFWCWKGGRARVIKTCLLAAGWGLLSLRCGGQRRSVDRVVSWMLGALCS